jgi:hypothetical protein
MRAYIIQDFLAFKETGGDSDFAALICRLRPMLFGFSRMAYDPNSQEDLMQILSIEVLKSAKTFFPSGGRPGETGEKTLSVQSNQYLNYMRKDFVSKTIEFNGRFLPAGYPAKPGKTGAYPDFFILLPGSSTVSEGSDPRTLTR